MCMEKLKLLCLHGYRQDAESFKTKTGAFRKVLKKDAQFIYISAPFSTANENERAWWFSNENNTFSSAEVTDVTEGLEASINAVEKAVEELGPFDGIVGFSQGAAMAALLCVLMEEGNLKFSFKFAILVAGFKSLASPHAHFYNKKVHIPSLHVIGATDQVINHCKSDELAEMFEACQKLHHEGGHYIPTSGQDLKKGYVEFLSQFKHADKS